MQTVILRPMIEPRYLRKQCSPFMNTHTAQSHSRTQRDHFSPPSGGRESNKQDMLCLQHVTAHKGADGHLMLVNSILWYTTP